MLAGPEPQAYAALEVFAGVIYWIFTIDLLLRVFTAGKALFTWAGVLGFVKTNWLAMAATIARSIPISSSAESDYCSAGIGTLIGDPIIQSGGRFPVTIDGSHIATMLMVVGIGLFSSLTTLLAAWFTGERKKAEEAKKAKLAR